MLPAVLVLALSFLDHCNGSPTLIFTTTKDIRVANVSRPSKVKTIVKDQEVVVGVDFYYEGNLVCWTDHKLGILCVTYNGTYTGNKMTVVNSHVVDPDGLACDWLTQKLYWTDGGASRIEVVTLDGKYRNVLFWEDIDQPRAIALVPTESLMFWTDWGDFAKIERASMDGDKRSRKVLVSEDLFWPNGLTVDFESRKVYWLDGKLRFVAVMDYDGRNRRNIADNKGILHPVSLAIFKDKLYWTCWETWAVHMLDRNTGGESRELIHCTDHTPIDVKVMDASKQPYKATPCQVNNGGCSHLCLLSVRPLGYSCSCPTGIKLIDNYTCADGLSELLLSVQRSEISLISLDTPDHTVISLMLKGLKHVMDVDYDPVHGHMYWSDNEAHVIRRARLDSSGQEDIVSSELSLPDGLAVDWRAQNLYWTDAGTDRIQVTRLNTSYTKVLISTDLKEPRAIAVSPDEGLMFWTDWYEKRPKVERSALDGSRRAVIANQHLGWPNGIALDIPEQKVYWCDAKTDRIEVINYDGTNRKEVVTDNIQHTFGLTLLGDYLYWSDWQRRGIESAHKVTGGNRKVILDQQANLMGLKAVGKMPEPTKYNPCADNNGNCSHLCLNTPTKYVCACQMGYELSSDSRSCVVPQAFLLYARKENIGRISIENRLNDAIIPVSGVKDAGALDYDVSDNRFYWTDVKGKAISRAYINGSHVETIIEFGLESPEGLAVDWVGHNVYWTDTGTRRIEVSRLDGTYRRTIIWSGLQEPKSIAVDPSQGFIYWSEWAGAGSIHRALLDGSEDRILVDRVGRANSLTVDTSLGRIYWCATQGAVEASSFDGSGRHVVVTSSAPYTMSLYQDKIYWSDWQNGNLYTANKRTGLDKTVLHSKLDGVTSVVVWHRDGDYGTGGRVGPWRGTSPCHDCHALCLGHRCTCPTHYTLNSNRKCIPPSTFLLFSSKNSISRLVENSSECPDAPLPIHGLKNVKAVEYDPFNQMLYWIDGRSQIRRWSHGLNGGFSAPPTLSSSLTSSTSSPSESGGQPSVASPPGGTSSQVDAQHPTWLAVDSHSRVLFWSSASEGTINATKLDNSSSGTVVVVRINDIEKPKQIALHPLKGFLFWVGEGRESHIYRCRMDGVRRRVLVHGLPTPVTALTVDTSEDIVYWATASAIEAITIQGTNRREVFAAKKVSGLAVSGRHLYWIHAQTIVSFDKETKKMKNLFVSHYHLTGLVAVNPPPKKSKIPWECFSGNEVESYLDCSRDRPCSGDQFACASSSGDCIPVQWRCDAATDCPDGSDEVDCPPCPPNKFTCQPGHCIGGCQNYFWNSAEAYNLVGSDCVISLSDCYAKWLGFDSVEVVLDERYVCDGTPQCTDSSDERDCCSASGGHQCQVSGSSTKCLPAEMICNGWNDCMDGSDESAALCRQAAGGVVGPGGGPGVGGPASPQAPAVPARGGHEPPSAHVLLASFVVFSCLVLAATTLYRCRRRLKPGGGGGGGVQMGDPLAPVGAGLGTGSGGATGGAPRPFKQHLRLQGRATSTTSQPSSGQSLLCYPLNPPPSPATTGRQGDCCGGSSSSAMPLLMGSSSAGSVLQQPPQLYRPPPPTPCSTDVCHDTDSNYQGDSDPLPPPPTPTSLSPSPSSSTYFHPAPPPPSPTP